MNIFKSKFTLFFLVIFVLLLLPFNVFAKDQTFDRISVVTLDKDQTINHDYFAAGERVTIDGTINGDAYIAGGQIEINGIINGDLLVASGQTTIRGSVTQNIRAIGGDLSIQGEVGRNISLAGGNIVIDKNAKITGNAVIAGGNSEIFSPVKDLTLAGGAARIASNISGNVMAGIGMLEIAPDTTISGNLEYWSNNQATIAPGARILKSTTFHRIDINPPAEEKKAVIYGAKTFFSIICFISSLILGILFIYLLPVYSQRVTNTVTNRFWLSMLIGFISVIVIPIVSVILFTTIIGIPFAIFVLFVYAFILYVFKIFVALAIGKAISTKAKWNMAPIWALVFGLVLYFLIGFIPIVGGLIKIAALFVGTGAFVLQEKYYFNTLRSKKIV